MKKDKQATFLLSFLDILSNALAAVFILAMVRLQPDPPGLSTGELYYISVTREIAGSDSTLMIAARFGDDTDFSHSPDDYKHTDSRVILGEKSTKLLFLKEPKRKNIKEIICYLSDPEFAQNEGEECIVIRGNLPEISFEEAIILNKENSYRTKIFQNGKFVKNLFIFCDDNS